MARAELPDGSGAWLISGYEHVRQSVADQRFSQALAVPPAAELKFKPGKTVRSLCELPVTWDRAGCPR